RSEKRDREGALRAPVDQDVRPGDVDGIELDAGRARARPADVEPDFLRGEDVLGAGRGGGDGLYVGDGSVARAVEDAVAARYPAGAGQPSGFEPDWDRGERCEFGQDDVVRPDACRRRSGRADDVAACRDAATGLERGRRGEPDRDGCGGDPVDPRLVESQVECPGRFILNVMDDGSIERRATEGDRPPRTRLAGVLGERGKEWQRSRGMDPELRAGRPDAAEIERGAPEVDIEARDVEGTNGDGLDSRRPERDVVAARATDGAADEPGGGPGLVVACPQV